MKLPMDEISGKDVVILCATGRLAQSIRVQYDRSCIDRGLAVWNTLVCKTVDPWLSELGEAMLLRGDVENQVLAATLLDATGERLLWEQAILQSLEDESRYLFDIAALATSAAQAHELVVTWQVPIDSGVRFTENIQFERWRRRFMALCETHGVIDAPRYRQAVIAELSGSQPGKLPLPTSVVFAGFDRFNPADLALQQALIGMGVDIRPLENTREQAQVQAVSYPDAASEMLAAATWARQTLEQQPDARIAIVVPDLASRGNLIHDALQDRLVPETLYPALSEVPMPFNLSLGRSLDQYPLVAVAIDLLEIMMASREVAQAQLGRLLRSPYWSGGVAGLASQAVVEAGLRAQMPASAALGKLIRTAEYLVRDFADRDKVFLLHLQAMKQAAANLPGKQLPSGWRRFFLENLTHAGWLHERTLSSHEFQTRAVFLEEMARFGHLDSILGEVSATTALRHFREICGERVFQPRTEGDPPIQVLGMLEASGLHFDAVWVTGMIDTAWPPPASPNPLLSSEAQRQTGSPNACAAVQLEFARSVQAKLNGSARQIIYSRPRTENGAELRGSPLISHLSEEERARPNREHWIADLFRAPGSGMAAPVDDSRAPPVQADEKIRGGTWLLRAQAICPAWAYFQFRLGANALEQPLDGLDSRKRGTLVHKVLEKFWGQVESSERLHALVETAQLETEIARAVDSALAAYDAEAANAEIKPGFRRLERSRLLKLLADWLVLELARELPFRVVARESSPPVNIGGIKVNIHPDRIDQLQTGELLIIDYKTGASVDTKNWASERITEPQLPVYAAMPQYEQGPVIGVVFAKVLLGEPAVTGLAGRENLLSKLPAFDSKPARKLYPEESFATWKAVLESWRGHLQAIAEEIRAGDAGVRFANEQALKYCDVKPLLRLDERRAQWLAARRAQQAMGGEA
jgi:exodeoxyribonuclease-5